MIAGHGKFAEGLANTAEMITGTKVDYLCLYINDEDPDKIIEKYVSEVDSADRLLIFTDIIGGSVNQKLLMYTNCPNIYLFSGTNLPMVLSAILMEDDMSDNDIEEIIMEAREGIQFMNRYEVDYALQDEL